MGIAPRMQREKKVIMLNQLGVGRGKREEGRNTTSVTPFTNIPCILFSLICKFSFDRSKRSLSNQKYRMNVIFIIYPFSGWQGYVVAHSLWSNANLTLSMYISTCRCNRKKRSNSLITWPRACSSTKRNCLIRIHTIDSLTVYLIISSEDLMALKIPSTTLGSKPFCFSSHWMMFGPWGVKKEQKRSE